MSSGALLFLAVILSADLLSTVECGNSGVIALLHEVSTIFTRHELTSWHLADAIVGEPSFSQLLS
uniref:Uncharacterized protein n=1 Tax=Arundo donax TaxID=35708 RepID=A0A0A9AVS8_ARUDO